MIRPHWTTWEELCMLERPSIVYLPQLWILNLPETREHFYWEIKLPCSKNLGPRTIIAENVFSSRSFSINRRRDKKGIKLLTENIINIECWFTAGPNTSRPSFPTPVWSCLVRVYTVCWRPQWGRLCCSGDHKHYCGTVQGESVC